MSKLVLALTLAGCYAPDLADCTVSCATDGDCGGGQVCTGGMCSHEGVSCKAAPPGVDAVAMIDPDAGIEPDAPEPDAPPPPPTTTLRVKIKDRGRVTPSGMAACTQGECTYTVEVGQAITLTADPDPGYRFEKWEEACTGHPLAICTLTVNTEARVTGKFKKLGPGNNNDDE